MKLQYAPVGSRRVFISVAEVSGDKHAAQLIRSLKQLDPSIQIDALGQELVELIAGDADGRVMKRKAA